MNKYNQHIASLIVKYLREDLTPGEQVELNQWVNASSQNKLIFDQLTQETELREKFQNYNTAKQRIWNKISKKIEKEKATQVHHRIPLKYIAVAVAVLAIITSGIYFWFEQRPPKNIAENPVINRPLTPDDIKPGTDKAILTLSDGTKVILDSVQNGTLASEKGVTVIKLNDGQVVYRKTDQSGELSEAESVSFNTISTPRGGRYHLVLDDGTRVWLNATSSISYPVTFTRTERTVAITGEVYFEVNPLEASRGGGKVPFKVKILSASGKETGEVEVLGTHFNINAYDDEAVVRTTLLEGSVKIQSSVGSKQSTILKPNQQVLISNDQLSLVANPNTEEVMAWKNGLFQFKGADIETIMRQAARWYDIDIVYERKPADKFTGKISRDVNLSGLLKILELSEVRVTLNERRKLIIR